MLVDTSNCLFDINSILFLVMAWGQAIAKLIMTRVPFSYEWVGVQWTHNFQNEGSKWDHKESIHFISFLDIWP